MRGEKGETDIGQFGEMGRYLNEEKRLRGGDFYLKVPGNLEQMRLQRVAWVVQRDVQYRRMEESKLERHSRLQTRMIERRGAWHAEVGFGGL